MASRHRACRTTAVLAATLAIAGLSQAASGEERFWPPIVDPPTGQHHPGRWVWGDLVTSDVAKAADFYGKVFGWTFETYGGDDDLDTYTLVLADGLPIGGMVFDERAIKDARPSARWVPFASVPDVAAAAAAVTQRGGTVVLAPVMLGERGMTAVFKDHEGALFGAVHSRNGDPADYAPDPNEWLWLDLWSDDVARTADFYAAVVGYTTVPIDGEVLRHGVHLVSGGFARAGIMEKRAERATPTWLPYVLVTDVASAVASARAAGGKILLEPVELKRAKVAIVADPTGAPVGLAEMSGKESQP